MTLITHGRAAATSRCDRSLNSIGEAMPTAKQLDEVIALLASLYPNTFAVFQQRRKPLKLKITLTGRGARRGRALGAALGYYLSQHRLPEGAELGAARIDIAGTRPVRSPRSRPRMPGSRWPPCAPSNRSESRRGSSSPRLSLHAMVFRRCARPPSGARRYLVGSSRAVWLDVHRRRGAPGAELPFPSAPGAHFGGA